MRKLAGTTQGRVPVALTQIEEHFEDQLDFLAESCRAFDEGKTSEYKRIALAIRVLAYDKGQSRSLLGQLDMKGGLFMSYAHEIDPKNLISSHPLVMIRLVGSSSCFVAMLNNGPFPPKYLPFEVWWNEEVFRSPDGTVLTRGDFVSIVANQDGGAHVDPEIDERYSRLVNKNLAGWFTGGPEGESPLLHIAKAHLRHIGFEFSNSVGEAWQRRMGNRLCECGSGRKYRYCHGKAPKA